MVEIVTGPTDNKRKEFTCFNCGTIYRADKWDYEFWDPNGNWGYRCPCPICKDNSWHYQTDDPLSIQYKGVKDV